MEKPLYQLNEFIGFPPIECAQDEPNGLLAIGGDLSLERLIKAYSHGIFPWFCEGEPILWWSPDPRCVFNLTDTQPIHLSKSLKRKLNKGDFSVQLNTNFAQVIASCSLPRAKQAETWILPEMQQAYINLHQQGVAHSVEVYDLDKQLIGGLYGVSLGKFFFGESMFSLKPDASKIALAHLSHHLQQAGFILIDCQVPNEHLYSLGAVDISRDNFLQLLDTHRHWQQPQDLFKVGKELSDW